MKNCSKMMVLVAAFFATVLAIPLGILASENRAVSTAMRPVLDFMQTLPGFVYLLPVVMFYGIGVVPGMIATIVFCMPPGVRLTELGLRQVDREVVEAGQAFGASPAAILARIKLRSSTRRSPPTTNGCASTPNGSRGRSAGTRAGAPAADSGAAASSTPPSAG